MKRIFALLLSATLLLGGGGILVWADAGDNDSPFVEPPETESTEVSASESEPPIIVPAGGMSFDIFGTYSIPNALSAIPRTVEAELYLPATHPDNESGGVILSNEVKGGDSFFFTVDIYRGGSPRVTYKSRDFIQYNYVFDAVDVRGEDFVHLCVVLEPEIEQMHCYIDGVLAQTLTMDYSEKPYADCHSDSAKAPFFIGGDASEKNPNYFRGSLRSVAVFSDARTAEEILADTDAPDTEDAALLCAYDMESAENGVIEDLSVNQNNLIIQKEWFSASAGGAYEGAYDFSLAVVGDTQLLTYHGARNSRAYLYSLSNLYGWIADNTASKNIQYCIGLGDITEQDTEKEWNFAKNAITRLDGVLPYSLIRGQGHDTVPQFNHYFAQHTPFTSNLSGTYREGSVANSWQEFTYGSTSYLILSLDFGAPDEILTWANGVVEAHPDHRVIVVTHAYLEGDGSTLDKGDPYHAAGYPYQEGTDSDQAKNDGAAIWRKLVSKHENIFLVLSGHMSADDVVINQRKGEKGNTVTEMMIDPQTMDGEYEGGTGMVAMLYFSEESDTVGVEYYSTVMDVYRPVKRFDINHTHEYTKTVVPPECGAYGYTLNECACGESFTSDSVPALRHEYDDEYDGDCNLCGTVREVAARPATEYESESESEPMIESESEPATESESEPATESESEPATESESEPATESESEPATESESEPATESESEPATESESEPAIESESEPATESERGPAIESEREPTIDSESEPTIESEHMSETEEETDAPITNGNGDNNAAVIVTVIAVGGVAVVGGGGAALWYFLSKKRR